MRNFEAAYRDIRKRNNDSDLKNKQEEAKRRLRLDVVYSELLNGNYDKKLADLKAQEEKRNTAQKEIDDEEKLIQSYLYKISETQSRLAELLEQTKNEKKLADNINKKLRNYVSFELEHFESFDHKGYYRVRDLSSGETRHVTELSTGEKNIIALLYFLEKLNEVRDNDHFSEKYIVIDDPVNSNDISMQNIVIEELRRLINRIEYQEKNWIVILTHNIDFYLNICRTYSDDFYQKRAVYHMEKDKYRTNILQINSRAEDFSTHYDVLWDEVKNLYRTDNIGADSIINTMRRILETYTRFNKLNLNKFCGRVAGAKGIFDENSHGISDLNSIPTEISKKELLKLFYLCFQENNAAEHIKRYWPEIESELL